MRSPREIIIRPVVTERSTEMADEHDTYTFIVTREANKLEIRHAVETLWEVKVEAVRTMNYRGKMRRVGRSVGRRPGYKKAVVKVAPGARIDVYEGV